MVNGFKRNARHQGISSNAVTTNIRLIEEFKTANGESYSNDLSKVETENTNTNALQISKENFEDVSDFSMQSGDMSELKSFRYNNFVKH